MSNPNNGGACFTCSVCHRECRCINESVREGVCVDCYDHIQNTLHDVGGNCFTCSSCHRTCSCCNESVMSGVCKECYQIHIYEQQHAFEEYGGNCFKCTICGRQCHCLNESHVDGVCVECIYQNDSIHLFLPATSFYSGYDFAINNSTWNIRQYFDTYNNTNYDIDELSDLRSSGCWKVE